MKNKILKNIFVFFFIFILEAQSNDQFDFNVTEIEILNNGNLIKGIKKAKSHLIME